MPDVTTRPRVAPPARSLAVRYHAIGIVVAFMFLAPLVWSVLVSFKPTRSRRRQPPLPPWPVGGFSPQSYENLEGIGAGIWTYTGNSLTVSVATVLATVLVSLLAGYGFSRFRFPFKNVLFVLIISTVMIPFQSILTPLFLILTKLGLQNIRCRHRAGLRDAADALFDLHDAQRLRCRAEGDRGSGPGRRRIRLHDAARVMLPLVLPGVATVAIFAFLASWNEFLAALILLTDQKKYTLPVLMAAVRCGQFGTIDWGAVQSGVTLMMAPCLVLFLLLQRYYIRGLTAGAVK